MVSLFPVRPPQSKASKANKARRSFLAGSAAATAAFVAARARAQVTTGNPAQLTPSVCTTVPDTPTVERPPPQQASHVFGAPEAELAFRNHGMHAASAWRSSRRSPI
jgi:hypothetical protein